VTKFTHNSLSWTACISSVTQTTN